MEAPDKSLAPALHNYRAWDHLHNAATVLPLLVLDLYEHAFHKDYDAASGRVHGEVALSGAPDVIFLNPRSGRLYVAIGDPGVIDVVSIGAMRRVEVVPTEAGAHTLALDRKRNKIYAFLPRSHRTEVFVDPA